MAGHVKKLQHLIDLAKGLDPIRVAVADAAQRVVIETLREAHALGFVEPRLVGEPDSIAALCEDIGWETATDWIVPAQTDAEIGRASSRERVWQYVEITGVAGTIKKK